MSPLFSCSGCGVQIERSVRLYREQRGQLLCSTCKDKQQRLQELEPPESNQEG